MIKTIINFLLGLVVLFSFSQEKKYDEVYIYIENDQFIPDILGYKAYFSLPSEDKRFQSDNYYFRISFPTLDNQSLYELGESIDIETVKWINPYKYFEEKSNCDLHSLLSLYKRIYIVTDIPKNKLKNLKDKSKKYIMWYTHYAGTIKNIVHTNMFGKILLED